MNKQPRVTVFGHGESILKRAEQPTPDTIAVVMSGAVIDSFKRSLARQGLCLIGPAEHDPHVIPKYLIAPIEQEKRRNGL
jgi:hypothetical protein